MILLPKGGKDKCEQVVAATDVTIAQYYQQMYPSENPANSGRMAYLSRVSKNTWKLTHLSFPEEAYGTLAELMEWWEEKCPVPVPDPHIERMAENIINPPPEQKHSTTLSLSQRLEIEDLLKDL